MSAVHGRSMRLLVNDLHVSGQLTGYDVTASRNLGDATNALSSGEQWVPGQHGGSVSIDGLFDSTIGLQGEISSAMGTDDSAIVTLCPEGFSVGALAISATADPSKLTVTAKVKSTTTISVEAAPDNGVDLGVVLAAHAQVSADANGTSVDNGAATTTNGVAYLHCTEFTDLTSIDVTVEDSANDTDFTTIATFTQLTTTGRQAVAITGTIRRYVRAVHNVTGTGTATFAVALARR